MTAWVALVLSVALFVVVMAALGSLIWEIVRPYNATDAYCDAVDLELDGRHAEAGVIRSRA